MVASDVSPLTTHHSLFLVKPFALPQAAVIISPGMEDAQAVVTAGLFRDFSFVAIIPSRQERGTKGANEGKHMAKQGKQSNEGSEPVSTGSSWLNIGPA